jgi:predicted nucleotidyltransferase
MDSRKLAEQNKILEIRVGSHLFGTTTPDSDVDLMGIFMPWDELVYGFQRCEEVDLSIVDKDDTQRNTKDAVDRKYYEYRKFIRLAIQNNPNILHMLFVNTENIVHINRFGHNLLSQCYKFPSKEAYHRFVGYAHSQRHKMRIKPENYAKLEKGLEILENEPHNKVMAELKDVPPFEYTTGNHLRIGDIHIEITFYVKKARKMVKDRLAKASHRAGMFTKYGYDLKFASNLIQLLMEGIELMKTGRIVMPLAYRQDILDIKAGKYTAVEIMNWSDDLVAEGDAAYKVSELPGSARGKEIEAFAINEVKTYLKEREI